MPFGAIFSSFEIGWPAYPLRWKIFLIIGGKYLREGSFKKGSKNDYELRVNWTEADCVFSAS
jgi:hypothetical protein